MAAHLLSLSQSPDRYKSADAVNDGKAIVEIVSDAAWAQTVTFFDVDDEEKESQEGASKAAAVKE
eukprot:6438487-Alexandrium_andersonii.AAC.1